MRGGAKRYSAPFQMSSNSPRWCRGDLGRKNKICFIFLVFLTLFFNHSFPSRLLCSFLSVKHREATSNCGFPEGAETFKTRTGSRSVSWKCQLSPSEEARCEWYLVNHSPKAVYLRFCLKEGRNVAQMLFITSVFQQRQQSHPTSAAMLRDSCPCLLGRSPRGN